MEFMFLSRFWGNGEGRKEGEFQSLEVRLQLIALKNSNLVVWPVRKSPDEYHF